MIYKLNIKFMANLFKKYKYCYIYKIINLINKKCYVGFHVTNLEYEKDFYYGSSETLDNAIKKYGEDNFIKGIIEYISINDWKEKEKYWIIKMNSHVSLGGYNLTWGGDGTLGFKMNSLSKEKLSNIARNRSEETKEKIKNSIKLKRNEINKSISKSLSGRKLYGKSLLSAQNAFLGKTHTMESKIKIGLKHKGKHLSQETKEKLKLINLGKHLSQETKIKISQFQKDKKLSAKTKQKISQSKIGVKRKTHICPFCQKEIGDGNFQRWHGINCKLKYI
jgi:group I intron endonuclease